MDTSKALNSGEWLNISSDSMQEFLQFECLNVIEGDLVRALIKWGKFQLQKFGDDLRNAETLREKILPGLQNIRFESLSHEEFGQLCRNELGAVLSGDEKSSIFMSIITGDWMATEVAPTKLAPRRGPYVVCELPFDRDPTKDSKYLNYWGNKTDLLIFSINEPAV